MKTTLNTAALAAMLAAASAAQAQSNVQVYGVVDLGLAKISGKPLVQRENHASRLGLRGSEDLGGGLQAIFNLESEILADTGAYKGVLFERQAYVGLKGGFGTLLVGRTKNIVDGALSRVEPFNADGVIGKINEAMMRSSVLSSRVNNALTYTTPKYMGFGAGVQYAVSEVKGADAGVDVLITYDRDAVSLHAGYARPVQTATLLAKPSLYTIGGGYRLGAARVTAAYAKGDTDVAANGKLTAYLVGWNYTVGKGDLKAVVSRQEQSNNVARDLEKVRQIGVGYDYHLSKRTDLYSYLGRERVVHASSLQAGISHRF